MQIPRDNVLTSEFTVSRFVVRRALKVLKGREKVSVKKGVGTLPRADSSIYGTLTGPLEDMVYDARESTIKLLRKEIFPAPFRDPFSL
ncbi:MAG: GntR family transcriptional regulator [Thermodesulfobacteriota bacterium]